MAKAYILGEEIEAILGIADDTDRLILQILKMDGRVSIRNIARRLEISPATVSRKIKNLEENNIIKAYVSIVEDDELGKGTRAVLLVKTTGDYDSNQVVERLTDMDDICNVFLTMGNYDMILTACTTDENELYRMIKRIRGEEGVLWVDSASIVTRKKVLSKIIKDNKEI
ncbi:Lrp/AsnC family transcriptional regulator [Candidatus Bathyarchaeota archaeon]|nr:Lrp/AsnC family transcriptional regulator [Candidatus Bathyarchaeota archaeon]